MAYGNGVTGDMGMHMFDTVRWLLQLKWPRKVSATGGIYVQKEGKSTIADTQTAVFEYEDLNCIWQHRTWGTAADPEYPWAFIIYGDKGTLNNHLPVADIEEGYISTASCILANLSMKLNRPLVFDPEQKICVDDPEATRLLRRPYRSPWQHPYS